MKIDRMMISGGPGQGDGRVVEGGDEGDADDDARHHVGNHQGGVEGRGVDGGPARDEAPDHRPDRHDEEDGRPREHQRVLHDVAQVVENAPVAVEAEAGLEHGPAGAPERVDDRDDRRHRTGEGDEVHGHVGRHVAAAGQPALDGLVDQVAVVDVLSRHVALPQTNSIESRISMMLIVVAMPRLLPISAE